MDKKSASEKSLHEKLSDENIGFAKKLKLAVNEGVLDYWWGRGNPPNESPDVFRKFLKKLKNDVSPDFVHRKSVTGPNCLLGEKECFKFEQEISMFGKIKRFFVKGYFYNDGDLKGVTIQSFREMKNFLKLVE